MQCSGSIADCKKNSIHKKLIPGTFVSALTIGYDKHCRVTFGTYVQVHEQHNNSMMPRTSKAIALKPSRNAQGSHVFLNLHSGECIIHNNCPCRQRL